MLLKNGTLDGCAYKPRYFWTEFTLHGASGTLGNIATSSCQI